MGMSGEDAVEIELGKKAGDPTVVTVNCTDKTGLGCDLCRIILEFGLRITRADVSTDGSWCFIVFWVVPRSDTVRVRWSSLKNRLMAACPTCPIPFYNVLAVPETSQMYLLKLFSADRKGLLHDVTQVLSELDLFIQRVKVSTTPDGRVVDLFFINDGMELLHTKKRQADTCERLYAVLGKSCVGCEIELVEGFQQGFSSLPPAVAEELFRHTDKELNPKVPCSDIAKLKKPSVVLDNSLSPSHTLLQIHSPDQRNLSYDILRTLKDFDIQIAYGRFMSDNKGLREIDLFILQNDGKKIVEPEKQGLLVARLKQELLQPLRVMIISRGPDTELLVANPVELCGRGRPLVFFDCTRALKLLGICIFSAEIGRHSTPERQWEVYRFRLDDSPEFLLTIARSRDHIVDRVWRTLMGW